MQKCKKTNLNKKSALCSQLISKGPMNNPVCVWLGVDQIMQIQQTQLCVFNCLLHLETLRKRLKVAPQKTSSNWEPLHIISWKSIPSLWFCVQCKVVIPKQPRPLRAQKSSPKKMGFFLVVCCSRLIAEPETADLKGEENNLIKIFKNTP